MRTGTVSYKLEDLRKGVIIPIGMVGENDFTRVIFDAEEVFKKHPDAQVTMKVQPPKGGIYPTTVTRDGNTVTWQVKAADVAHRGSGELQLTFTADTMVEKSYIARTDIKRSLVGNGPAPDPVQDWVDNAEEVLEDLEAAEVHQPIIGLDGYWYTWNQGTGEYEKTNTKAQGQDGHSPVLTSSKSGKTTTIFADGDQLAQILDGEDGQGADVIDDTAGEGDTDKTWSANKLDEELTDVKSDIQGQEKEIFDVVGEQREITFLMGLQGWSAPQNYTMVKGHSYKIEIVSGYNIESNNLLFRIYDINNVPYLAATITETPFVIDSQYSGKSIGIGALYYVDGNVVIKIKDVTLSETKNEVDNLTSNVVDLHSSVGRIEDITDNNIYRIDDLEFGKDPGWVGKEYNLKKGNSYHIAMHNIAFPCTAFIRFYETQNGQYVQANITTEESASFDFAPEHNYTYISVGLPETKDRNVFLKIEYNILEEEYVRTENTTYPSAVINDVGINNDDKYNFNSYRSLYENPFDSLWGGEYLASYYNKINGRNSVLIALDGDSITAEGYRNTCIDDIFRSGGYYTRKANGTIEMLYSLFNNGKGAASTVEWVGTGEPYNFNGRIIPANGMLSESMAENPDLLIIAFGTNDATLNMNSTTIEERINGLAERMEEGLKRIRGTSPVNGREAYGKDVNNLAVIVCVPPGAKTEGRAIKDWHIYVQKIYANLARKYKCAFVDFSISTFDVASYNSLNKWGDIGISDPTVHPNQAFSKYYASVLQPLIYPFGYWNCQMLDDIPKSGTTSDRPSKKDVYVGYSYYCTDTHKPIFCNAKGTKAKCTFTVGTMSSDISQYSTGGMRVCIGNVSIIMMIINTVYVYAKAADQNKINEYMARYLCEALNARGFHSECNGATFTLENDECGEVSEYGFTDNVSYGATNIPITCALTTNGTENEWMDVNGNTIT